MFELQTENFQAIFWSCWETLIFFQSSCLLCFQKFLCRLHFFATFRNQSSILLFRLVRRFRFRLINLLLFGGIDRQLFYMDLPHVKWNYAPFMINRSQTLRLSNSLCSRYFLFKRIFHASEAFLLKVRKKTSNPNPPTEGKIEYCRWAVLTKRNLNKKKQNPIKFMTAHYLIKA